MEQKPPKPMTPFDNATTPHHLYMLKLLLPYTPPSMQHILAVYIKVSELQYTIRHFSNLARCEMNTNLFSELKPYMEPEEKEQLEQMEDMMNMMEMVQNIQSMSEPMFQAASDGSEGFHPLDLMKGMMSPEDQEMFDMYSSMFENGMDHKHSSSEQEGDVTHERMDEQSGNEEYGSAETRTDQDGGGTDQR